MSAYNREYLRSLPERNKHSKINDLLGEFHSHIIYAASSGLTSAMFELPESRVNMGTKYMMTTYKITADDLVVAFQKKYPDCAVRYVDMDECGIIIDWS
jgi:hypothetical protein